MIWNAFLLALREIRNNLLRASLTTLGIVIGVSAVILMVTLGAGATLKVTGGAFMRTLVGKRQSALPSR